MRQPTRTRRPVPPPNRPAEVTVGPNPANHVAPTSPPGTGARYAGIDLAWSARNVSGIAVVDGAGRLLDSGAVTSDDDVAAWLAPHAGHLAVVALDAPLVVANATGSRPVERELTRAFRHVDAGTYPSNRANPLFDPPRALTLAQRFGWRPTAQRPQPAPLEPTGPGSLERSRGTGTDAPAPTTDPGLAVAVETYPHPAMVALFGLDRVIPYKPRPSRTLADRLVALDTLMTHLEAVAALALPGHDRWTALREAHARATRAVDLKRLEDELDGIFCAHVAWLWGTGSTALVAWGDDVEGFIVAPPGPVAPGSLDSPPEPAAPPGRPT
ncbi:DUF429 domain-containing protein [Litorihabitans aurantiacus]|nr:DUF429 domain-containing protein [Litorihabitans aurantiacus]